MENDELQAPTCGDVKRAQLNAAMEELLRRHRSGHKTSVLATALRFGVANSTLYRHFRAGLADAPAPSHRGAGTRRSGRRKLNDDDRLRVDEAVADLLTKQKSGQKTSFGSTAARFGVAKSTLYLHFRSLQAASNSTMPKSSSSANKGSIGYILATPALR